MEKLKNLATCKPSEFLKQSVLIRRSVEKWMTATDLLNIRKTLPTLERVDDSMSVEEKAQVVLENKNRIKAQARENALRIIDAVLEEHPDETLELLALLCFVEPSKVDDYPMEAYIDAISDLISSEAVRGFFTSLARWAQTNI